MTPAEAAAFRLGLEAGAKAVDDEADAEQMCVSVRLGGESPNLRDIAAAIRALPVPEGGEVEDGDTVHFMPSDGTVYRHRKTGGYYRVLANGRIEATRELVVIYQPIDGMMTWVRPTKEFAERFDYVPNGKIPDAALRATRGQP